MEPLYISIIVLIMALPFTIFVLCLIYLGISHIYISLYISIRNLINHYMTNNTTESIPIHI